MSLLPDDDGYGLPSPTEAELTAFLVDSGMDLSLRAEGSWGEDRSLPDYDDLFEDDE